MALLQNGKLLKGDFVMGKWIKSTFIKTIKTMAETALSIIGTNTIGITDVDWLGLGSAVLLSGFATILFNIKTLPEGEV